MFFSSLPSVFSTDAFSSFISLPCFTHPTYLTITLILTLVPLVLFIEKIGEDPGPPKDMAVKQPTRPEGPTREFKGDIKVNNTPPSKGDLEKAGNLPVLDVNKKTHTFKTLYAENENGPPKVLIVFIRHFFCGNCQEYIRTLGSSLTPTSLSSLPQPPTVIIIGCGSPDLIPMYAKETSCPYPIYADPSRKLYDVFGMTKTLSLGSKTPSYIQRSLPSVVLSSMVQGLRSGRHMLNGGDFWQVGGEFIFAEGKVQWCHRMKNTRDHAEILDLRKQMGLDEEAPPVRKRWSTAGLGAGLTRRLSDRRRSWGGSRSRSRDERESPPKSTMGEVKEENEKTGAVASGPDKGDVTNFVMDEKASSGVFNGTANDIAVS